MCTGLDLCDKDQLHPCHENQGRRVGDRVDNKRNHEVVKRKHRITQRKWSGHLSCKLLKKMLGTLGMLNMQQRQKNSGNVQWGDMRALNYTASASRYKYGINFKILRPVNAPMLSIWSIYVTSFSSYWIYKLSCLCRPPPGRVTTIPHQPFTTEP